MNKENIKILGLIGLYWKPNGDHYIYIVELPKIDKDIKITKRNILASIEALLRYSTCCV